MNHIKKITQIRSFHESVDAIILAAGGGTRMKPLSLFVSKPMLPISNKPFLAILSDFIAKAGLQSITIIVSNSNNKQVQDYFSHNPINSDIPIKFIEQDKALGTADALKRAKNVINSDNIFAIAGDNYFSAIDIINLILKHLNLKPEVTIALKRVEKEDITSLSSVLLNEDGYIKKIVEKPQPYEILSLYAATAVYAFKKDFFDILEEVPISKRGEYEVPTGFEQILKQNKPIAGYITNKWDHISNPYDLWRINMREVKNNVISTSAQINDTSKIIHSVIGDNCIIGSKSTLKNCLVLPNTILTDNSVYNNAILYTNNEKKLEVFFAK